MKYGADVHVMIDMHSEPTALSQISILAQDRVQPEAEGLAIARHVARAAGVMRRRLQDIKRTRCMKQK